MDVSRLALLALLLAGGRHPVHTTVAEVVQRDARGRTTIQVRVYTDDLRAAVPETADLPPAASGPTSNTDSAADSATARYLRGTFALADRSGHPVRLTWRGFERTGDVVLLRLEGEVPGGLAGAL